MKYIKLIRVKHYIKNLLVFAALACSGQIFDLDKLVPALLGFAAFCAIASAVYIINDIRDREKDANHPTKCKRPIASGAVSVASAWVLFAVMIIIAAVCNFFAFNLVSTILLAVYFVINVGYSMGLKDMPIIDITILVAGFLIRVLYGALITQITVSHWLYLTVIAAAFYFSLGKRRNELKVSEENKETRRVLKFYPERFLDKNMYMCLALANVFYALWATNDKTIEMYNTELLIFTVPIVLLITMKYSLNVEGESDGDPVEVLLHDKLLLVLCAVYLLTMFSILYLF
ncbi:MAG: decaprenyl-phosphate phosphoribosyltransferase [Clostridia bacterium]|nr:decaprenyl-phosphate phosphoribosyltransferase [Clostridia bacterium]